MSSKYTKEKDLGYDSIRKSYVDMDGSKVDVGIMRAEKYVGDEAIKGKKGKASTTSNITVTEIAIVHEFGSEKANIPERSFLRSTVDEKKSKYRNVLISLMWDVITKRHTVESALSLFGERVVGDIKRKITSIRVPPNKPSTISEKGFDNPLIRTGTLRSRIKKRVTVR